MISIDRIQIHNFRQYKEVELSFPDKTGNYFFVGENGIGKSNFMNAICWCLYGKILFTSDRSSDGSVHNIVNKESINAGDNTVFVKIDATIGGRYFQIKRSSNSNRVLNPAGYGNQSDFAIFESDSAGGTPTPCSNPELIIDQLLPEKLCNLFMFDGEIIKNLFDGNYSEKLKKQIQEVSNIDAIERAVSDIDKVVTRYERSKKTNANNAALKERLENSITECTAQLEDRTEKAKKYDVIDKELDGRYQDLMKELAKFESVQKQKEEYESLEKDIIGIIRREDSLNHDSAEYLSKSVPYAIIEDKIKKYQSAIRTATKNGQMPPDITTSVLNDIIESHKCICKRDLDEESKKAIETLLADSAEKERLSFLTSHTGSCDLMYREIKEAKNRIEKNDRELVEAEKLRDTKDKRLKVVKEEIESSAAYAQILANDPRKNIDEIKELIRNNNRDIACNNREIEMLEATIDKNKNQLSQIVTNSSQNNLLQNKILKLQRISRLMESVKTQILKNTKEKIEQGTTETYKKLHWKEELDKVILTDDYKLKIATKAGDAVEIYNLANGEKKMLGISLINALSRKLKSFDFPFFIDSPTEELDTSVVPKVLDNLRNLANDKQVFIMTLHKKEVDLFLDTIKNNKYELRRENPALEITSIERTGE